MFIQFSEKNGEIWAIDMGRRSRSDSLISFLPIWTDEPYAAALPSTNSTQPRPLCVSYKIVLSTMIDAHSPSASRPPIRHGTQYSLPLSSSAFAISSASAYALAFTPPSSPAVASAHQQRLVPNQTAIPPRQACYLSITNPPSTKSARSSCSSTSSSRSEPMAGRR